MRRVGTVSLNTNKSVHGDVQLWNQTDSKLPYPLPESFEELEAPVECLKIPLALVAVPCLFVCTESHSTEAYLESVMGWEAIQRGILGRGFRNKDMVLVLKVLGESLTCIVLHLGQGVLPSLPSINVWYTSSELTKTTLVAVPRTSKFDKILQKRKLSVNPFLIRDNDGPGGLLSPKASSTSSSSLSSKTVLSSAEQIDQTISKLILSGLRIRGLSINPSHSVNDKLTIKEIYHTTYKSAMFALRKYNYSFNAGSSVQLNQVQDIVEKLLQTYVDVDTNTSPPPS